MDQELVARRLSRSVRDPSRLRAQGHFLSLVPLLALFCSLHLLVAGVGDNPDVEVVYQLNLAPSVVTASADGAWVVGLDQSDRPQFRAVRVKKAAETAPFPTDAIARAEPSAPITLDAVEALHTDAKGIIWILDNGRRSEMPPKVVAWNDEDSKVQMVRALTSPATVPGSFLSDFVVDPDSPLVVISDPANGANAALILLDRSSGVATRVLQGHASVIPDPAVILTLPRGMAAVKRLDGTTVLPHAGVRPLAMDRKAEWLYYAPVQSRHLFRIPMKLLRRGDASADAIAAAVEQYAYKPPCSSFVIDTKGNIHLGDIESRAIGVIEAGKRGYRVIASDSRLLWPDGLAFGQDGKLYFFSRSLMPSAGNSKSSPLAVQTVHELFRVKPVAEGRAGD